MTDAGGMMVVISGPSGAGKGTVIKRLTEDGDYVLSVSMTTRRPRPGETEGKEYYFCNEREFKKCRDDGELLEYTEYNGYFYGTPKRPVEGLIAAGKIVILEIEVDGAFQIKEKFREGVTIFMMPPDKKELERRLTSRGTQTEISVRERLAIADKEISFACRYDYLVVNETVERAAEQIGTIVAAERLRPFRNKNAVESFN